MQKKKRKKRDKKVSDPAFLKALLAPLIIAEHEGRAKKETESERTENEKLIIALRARKTRAGSHLSNLYRENDPADLDLEIREEELPF